MFGFMDLLPALSRKKKTTDKAPKKTQSSTNSSTKDATPARPTAPKPQKNNKEASTKKAEAETKQAEVKQSPPKRNSTEERVTQQAELSLPDGIERKYDPNTNRFYYLNHKDKTTSWSLPDGKFG